jgi:hypothetical protein
MKIPTEEDAIRVAEDVTGEKVITIKGLETVNFVEK